jgi:hypothetical protein
MARLVTLKAIRRLCRLFADQRPGGGELRFIEDDDVNDLINLAIANHYDLLVAARGQEFYQKKSTAIATVAGAAEYNFPADFYQLISFVLNWGTNQLEPVPALDSFGSAHRFNYVNWGQGTQKAYRQSGELGTPARIELFPTPSSAVATIVRYVPTAPILTTDQGATGTFDGVNGWERAIALEVAIQMRGIQGKGAADLGKLYDAERQRIVELAADRAATAAPTIIDVNPESVLAAWQERLPPPT